MIRPFDNHDVPTMHQIWLAHYSQWCQTPQVTVDHFERAILGRPQFVRENLMVAVEGTSPVAWCQVAPHDGSLPLSQNTAKPGQGNPSRPSPGPRILSLVAQPDAATETIEELVGAVNRKYGPIQSWGNAIDHQHGYAGLDPVGWGIGVDVADQRVISLVQSAGLVVDQTYERRILPLSLFRMPVNRQFLTWRRTATVQSTWTMPDDSSVAAAMSHLDCHHWTVDAGDQTLGSMIVWTTDREAAIMPPTHALLDLMGFSSPTDAAFQFAVARVALEMVEQCVATIEVVVNGDQNRYRNTLDTMGFEPAGQGQTFVRPQS